MVKKLKEESHSADAIHGDLRQSKRDRVINAFRKGVKRILVATDVAARGLDIPLIQHVINYDLPQVPEDYVHRIGRTARAGSEGSALTFLTRDDKSMWNSISKLIDPNFKSAPRDYGDSRKKSRRGKNKKDKTPYNKKRRFKDKKEYTFKHEVKKKFYNKNKKDFRSTSEGERKKFDFRKNKKKLFKKESSRPEGYTNNPKYFGKRRDDSESIDKNKNIDFKKRKNRFKNRSRPKSFKFKKHRKNRN